MKPQRILMPSIYFPPRVGGIESHVFYLARELVRRGREVTVVTTRTESSSAWKETTDGIKVRRLPSFGKHFAGWALSSLFSVPEIALEARRADLIHCHTFAFALGGDVAKALGGPPLVVTVHSSHFLRLARKKLMRLPLRLLLGKAAVLLSTSKEIDQVVRCLLPKARTLPIVNGIDTDTFRPVEPSLAKVENEFLLVCPRRLVPKNGVEFLVRALGYLKDRLKVRLYIAGDGPLRRHLERVAADLGVLDRIVFKGDVPNTDMPAIYSSADLVVIPSLIEATSIAALEAMSCQRLVAASRVGGLPEIIDSRVGILFEPASPQAIAAAIVKAAGLHEASAMGMEARRRVEESWSIRRMTDIHEELYEALIKEAPAA